MKKILAFFLIFFLLVFSFSSNKLFAQGEANIWYFGDGAGLDFNSGTPIAITDGALHTYEGCATISNSSGSLLFYTDGDTVWNKLHQPMQNGTGLKGDWSSTQAALIVPKPGSSSIYYVFTTSSKDGSGVQECSYSEVDMTLSSGLGGVTTNKNILLSANSSEKLCAVKQANDFDFWVIAHEINSNTFLVYSITSSGVNNSPVDSYAGSIIGTPDIGYLKVSLNGNKLTNANYIESNVEVLNFNNLSGKVSDNFSIPFRSPISPYGVEFSPDGNLLYIANYGWTWTIYQYDLTMATPAAIIASSTVIRIGSNLQEYMGALQIGPDGKIYIATSVGPDGNSTLACINNPNARGGACGFVDKAINLSGKKCILGLPNFISSYFPPCNDFKIKINNVSICVGETAQLTAKGANSYAWSAEIISSGTNTAKVTPLVTTGYTVTATNGNNCSDTATFKVVVNSLPTLNLTPNVFMALGEHTILTAIASGNPPFTYQWAPSVGLDKTNKTIVIASPTINTKYFIITSDNNGCSDADSLTVTVSARCSDIFIPDAFSPNNDGNNDTLFVRQNTTCVKSFDLTIFDRWGNKVFETNDITKGWDGRENYLGLLSETITKEGEYLNTDIYFYMMNVVLSNNSQAIVKKGNVSLVR